MSGEVVIRGSLHGGHSAAFCDHAKDPLDELVSAYATAGFGLVALTEHMPPVSNRWRYPDEVALGRDAAWMAGRFASYVAQARQLQQLWAGQVTILVGMETEWYEGAGPWIALLRQAHGLEMVVGSVHHVAGLCFDASAAEYARVVREVGGQKELYLAFFDAQLEMLEAVRPEVVGHFDLVRIFDPHGRESLASPEVWRRVERNLEAVRDLGVVLDANVAGWRKGGEEIYPCAPIVRAARDLGIPVAYGDDAHAVAHVGFGWSQLAAHLEECGLCPGLAGPEGEWPVWRAMPAT